MKKDELNKATDKATLDLAASVLHNAGFKQMLIFATRLGSADDAEKVDESDSKEVKTYGLHTVRSMDTTTMLASVGAYIQQLMKDHPEETVKVAHFVASLIDDVLDDDKEAMN